MTTTITTVWADHTENEVRHTRFIDSHVTLCGLGTNLTRNFSKHVREDHRCARCQSELDMLNAAGVFDPEPSEERRIDSLTFPTREDF